MILRDEFGWDIKDLYLAHFDENDYDSDDFYTDDVPLTISYLEASEELQNRHIMTFFPSGSDATGWWIYADFDEDDFNSDDFYTTADYFFIPPTYGIQNLLNANRLFRVKGVLLLTSAKVSEYGREALRNLLVGKLGFIESEFIPQTKIFYYGITFFEQHNKPLEVEFVLELIEVKED